MSNKTQLATNNTTLDGYIARVNAAKNTAASLPEAGSGGGSVEILPVTVTNNGMYEPGINEYILSNENLKTSTRKIINLCTEQFTDVYLMLVRESFSESFVAYKGYDSEISLTGIIVDENSITVYGVFPGASTKFIVI